MRRNTLPAIATMAVTSLLVACGGAGGPSGGGGKISDDKIVLGVLNDQSGIYAELSGPNAVEAVKMAVEDFKAKYGDKAVSKTVEVVVADHQNKPEIANSKAQEMYDRQKADVILDVPTSSAALAVAGQALAKKKLFLNITAATTGLTGEQRNKYTFHWAYDTYMLANGTGTTVTKAGAKSWYIVYAARASSSSRAPSIATAACAASEQSSETSSRANGRLVRSAAKSTPRTWGPSSSGTPRMATRPSSATALSIAAVCWKRSSAA
jgi:branched-chain amino acid transport system substrate-binding protein